MIYLQCYHTDTSHQNFVKLNNNPEGETQFLSPFALESLLCTNVIRFCKFVFYFHILRIDRYQLSIIDDHAHFGSICG